MPPPLVVTLPGGAATVSPSRIPSYSKGRPAAGTKATAAATAATTTATTMTSLPVFFSGSQVITYQPQPTVSVVLSNPTNTMTTTTSYVVTYTNQAPKSTCHPGQTGCGRIDCTIFGCGGHCGKYGCDNGCGILGCGGGCGLTGCGFSCPPLVPYSGGKTRFP